MYYSTKTPIFDCKIENMPNNIQVETIGYFHAHSNTSAVPDLLPPKLNSNKQFIEDPTLPVPFIDLKQVFPRIMEFRESQLSSLLDYLRQKGYPDGEKPDFVTDRYFLKSIVAPEESTVVHIIRMDGVIYMHCLDGEIVGNSEYRWIFKHILTRSSVDDDFESEPIIKKAVFKATVPSEDGKEKYTVIYSGKVDAVDDDNQHYEIKVTSGGTEPYFWENTSYRLYWQALLGDTKYIVIGARTGKLRGDPKTRRPLCYPPYSIYEIQKFEQDEFLKKANNFLRRYPSKRQMEDGTKDIQHLLDLVKSTVAEDGIGYVFSRTRDDPEWQIEKDDVAVAEFRGTILKNVQE